MFSVIIYTYVATQRCYYININNNWYTRGMLFLVLSYKKKVNFFFLFLTADRDRTVSQRSEPSSRTTLISEQLNPWNLLQLQDVMSRHRGAKPLCRYEL